MRKSILLALTAALLWLGLIALCYWGAWMDRDFPKGVWGQANYQECWWGYEPTATATVILLLVAFAITGMAYHALMEEPKP